MRKSSIWMICSVIVFAGGLTYGIIINDGATAIGLAFVGFFMALIGLPFWMITGEEWEGIANALS